MYAHAVCGLLVAFAAMLPATGVAATPDFTPLARHVEHLKDVTAHPFGTAVAVVKDGRVLYEAYLGYADIGKRTPVTRDTVFYIASATKPFFALNALLKEAAGELDVATSLQQLFPDLRFAGFDAAAVTVRDLLTHTSGIDDPPLVWATAYSGVHDARSRRALVALAAPDAEAAHGTFEYTNVGYNILSVWMDQRYALSWQQQLERAIFDPLGMRHTTASVSRAEAAGWVLAKPYSFASARSAEPLYLTKSDQTMHAAGGLLLTAPDLARFLIAQLMDEGEPIARAVIARSHQPQAKVSSQYLDFERSGYAWGWYTGTYKGRPILHHFGGFAGFHAHLSFMPEDGIGLVVLNNDDVLGAQLTNLIADYVYGVLLSEPDVKARSERRFAELEGKAAALRAKAVEQRKSIESRPWNLSLPRDRYVGTYTHAALGDITLTLDQARRPVLRWGRLAATATGAEQRDHLRIEWVPNSGEFVAFEVVDGEVRALVFDRILFGKSR